MAAVQAAVVGVFTHWSLLLTTLFSIVSPDTVAGATAEVGGETWMPAAPKLSKVRPSTTTLLALTTRPFTPPVETKAVTPAPPTDSMIVGLPTVPDSAAGTVADVPAGTW